MLLTPDRPNDLVRSDIIGWTFTGIPARFGFVFQADIDDDMLGNSVEDFRTVFFNNGGAANSASTATFSNGIILSQIIPDQAPGLELYNFERLSDVVSIDIKPGKFRDRPNRLDPNSIDKSIKVAILGTMDFDALQVDQTTIRFGPLGAALDPAKCKVKDFTSRPVGPAARHPHTRRSRSAPTARRDPAPDVSPRTGYRLT